MKISVITPTFNSEAVLERNLISVNSQDYHDVEHVFIDNKSTDRTLEVIQRTSRQKNKIVSESDKGISDAFNKGIRIATGEIIAILNSDDAYFNSTTLSRVSKAFLERSGVDFVYGNMVFVDSVYGTNIRRPLECSVKKAMPFNHPAFFVRRTFYEKVGYFDEQFRFAMDFELVCRLYRNPNRDQIIGWYLRGEPLAIMYAGGASWIHERKALDEVERALKKNGLWDREAKINLVIRRMRIQLKSALCVLRLQGLIKFWRSIKWSR